MNGQRIRLAGWMTVLALLAATAGRTSAAPAQKDPTDVLGPSRMAWRRIGDYTFASVQRVPHDSMLVLRVHTAVRAVRSPRIELWRADRVIVTRDPTPVVPTPAVSPPPATAVPSAPVGTEAAAAPAPFEQPAAEPAEEVEAQAAEPPEPLRLGRSSESREPAISSKAARLLSARDTGEMKLASWGDLKEGKTWTSELPGDFYVGLLLRSDRRDPAVRVEPRGRYQTLWFQSGWAFDVWVVDEDQVIDW